MNNSLSVFMSHGLKVDPASTMVENQLKEQPKQSVLERSFRQDKTVDEMAFIFGGGKTKPDS